MNSYLNDHCLHLLESPTGDTGISPSYFESCNWTPSLKSQLTGNFSRKVLGSFSNQTGTYAIYSIPSDEFCIGSTTNLSTRFANHYSDSRDLSLAGRPLYAEVLSVGGFDKFLLDLVVSTPDHFVDFVSGNLDYAGDTNLWRALLLFTQYEARIYEQAVQEWLKPSLNGLGDVTFTSKWDPEDVRPSNLGEKPFTVISEDGSESFEVPSINVASEILGTSRKTISTVMNYPDAFVDCPNIGGKFRFLQPHMPLKDGSPYTSPLDRVSIEGFDFTTIPQGRIHALTEDFRFHSDYGSSREAAEALDLGGYHNVSRYINNKFKACVIGGVSIKLLFAQNPLSKGRTRSVLCLDTTTKTTNTYASVNECTKALRQPISFATTLIKKYIKPGKLYQGKYLISYVK